MKVGVFHPSLDMYGGAEVMAVIIANTFACNGYDVDLFVNKEIDTKKLMDMVGEKLNPSINITVMSPFFLPRGSFHLYENAIRSIMFKSRCDVLVDPYTNYIYPWTDVCYVHFPYLNYYKSGLQFPSTKTRILNFPFQLLEKNRKKGKKLLLTNSCFTAKVIEESMGESAHVLYPPISSVYFENNYNPKSRKLSGYSISFWSRKRIRKDPLSRYTC